jgi:hypothetical protein
MRKQKKTMKSVKSTGDILKRKGVDTSPALNTSVASDRPLSALSQSGVSTPSSVLSTESPTLYRHKGRSVSMSDIGSVLGTELKSLARALPMVAVPGLGMSFPVLRSFFFFLCLIAVWGQCVVIATSLTTTAPLLAWALPMCEALYAHSHAVSFSHYSFFSMQLHCVKWINYYS